MFHAKGPTFWELAVQAMSSTERGYDLLAPKFDYTPFRTPQFLLDAVARQLPAYEEKVLLVPLDEGAVSEDLSQAGCYRRLASDLRRAVQGALRAPYDECRRHHGVAT